MDRYHEGDLAEEITTEEPRRRLKKERGMKAPAEVAIRPGHIRDFTDSLLAEVEMMHQALGTLEDRLGPILRTLDTGTAAELEDSEELSPIGYQLCSIKDGLRGNRSYLSNLMDRIDL